MLPVLVLATAGLVAGARPAAAHDVLLRSVPADGTHLASPPATVELVFDEAVGHRFGNVVVAGPDGRTVSTGATAVTGATVSQPLAPLGPAGTYRVAYRIVSADGHPVSGSRTFVLDAPGPAAAPPPAATPAPPPAATPAPAAVSRASPAGAVAAHRAQNGGLPVAGLALAVAAAAAAGCVAWPRLRARRTAVEGPER